MKRVQGSFKLKLVFKPDGALVTLGIDTCMYKNTVDVRLFFLLLFFFFLSN